MKCLNFKLRILWAASGILAAVVSVHAGLATLKGLSINEANSFTNNSVTEAQQPSDRTRIEWPNPEFATLQSAVDALADGGRLRIAPGSHRVDAPVFVRRKRVIIEGAGCAELSDKAREVPKRTAEVLSAAGLDSRVVSRVRTKLTAEIRDDDNDGQARSSTQLFGPQPVRVVSVDDTIGLFNFVDAGGAVTGLKLTGFDAGIVTRQEDERLPQQSLAVTGTCIANTGRGVLALGPGNFTMEHGSIQDILWNGISAVGAQAVGNLQKQVSFVNVYVEKAGNACMVFKNVLGYAHEVYVHDCGSLELIQTTHARAGIGVVDSVFSITDSVSDLSHAGIVFVRSFGTLDDNILGLNIFAGMLLVDAQATVSNNIIAGTQARADGTFGDGLDAFLSNLTLFQNLIHQTDRAGVANFGGFMALGSNTISCAAFELEGEPFLGNTFVFEEQEGNVCGCEEPENCLAVSAGLTPPTAIVPEE